MCETRVLSSKGEAVISQCAECRAIYIWHNNLVLNFTESQFTDFRNFANDFDFEDRSLPFPDGTNRCVLRTPQNDINFAFTEEEWESFCAAMEEAAYMMEVYALMGRP